MCTKKLHTPAWFKYAKLNNFSYVLAVSLCSHCLHLHWRFQSSWASQSTAFPLALIYSMDFAAACNKKSVETLEILLVWGRHRCDWLKKNTSRGRGQTQIHKEMEDGSVQWNAEDSQPRWKDEGSEGLHVVAWTKPTDISGVTPFGFNYFSQT